MAATDTKTPNLMVLSRYSASLSTNTKSALKSVSAITSKKALPKIGVCLAAGKKRRTTPMSASTPIAVILQALTSDARSDPNTAAPQEGAKRRLFFALIFIKTAETRRKRQVFLQKKIHKLITT